MKALILALTISCMVYLAVSQATCGSTVTNCPHFALQLQLLPHSLNVLNAVVDIFYLLLEHAHSAELVVVHAQMPQLAQFAMQDLFLAQVHASIVLVVPQVLQVVSQDAPLAQLLQQQSLAQVAQLEQLLRVHQLQLVFHAVPLQLESLAT